MMKKKMLTCAVLSLGVATTATAGSLNMSDEAKRDTVIWGSLVTGAVAAGPVGAMLGVMAGSWLGEKVEVAGQVEETEDELARAQTQIDELTHKLAASNRAVDDYQQFALQQLQLELLFKTGVSELTAAAELKLGQLAKLLIEHPELHVRLDGHADPRGTQSYNQTLSEQRVLVAQAFLIARDVEAARFSIYSHGASKSAASQGDYDSYALERVVTVLLFDPAAADGVAQLETP